METRVISHRKRNNNYFKPFGTTRLFMFDAASADSVAKAWGDAVLQAGSPARVSVWLPFPIAGPWWGCHLIGHPVVSRDEPEEGESVAASEARERQLRLWNETRAYLL